MTEPSEYARSIAVQFFGHPEHGALREALAQVVDAARAECRREAIEECAVLLPALRRLIEEWPDVTPATWDIAQALLAKVALAGRPAPAAPPEPSEAEWLRRLLRWCRPRLKHPSYQSWLDQYLAAGPSEAPKDEPPIVRSETPPSAPSIHRVQDNTYVREPSEAEVEAAALAIAGLRSCSLEHQQSPVCLSCNNARGYSDDVGCMTLARAALAAAAKERGAMTEAADAKLKSWWTEIAGQIETEVATAFGKNHAGSRWHEICRYVVGRFIERAHIADLLRDAERYRWLRAHGTEFYHDAEWWDGEEYDALIDVAMAREHRPEGRG